MKFLHVMIRVKDLKKSIKFYAELFDMNLVEEKRLDDCSLYFLCDEDGQTQIELTYNDETPAEGYKQGTAFGHFAFSTPSFKEFTEKLHKMGYDYIHEPFNLNGVNSKIAFIKDPDGNEVEIIEE